MPLEILRKAAVSFAETQREGFQVNAAAVPAVPGVTMNAEIISVFDQGTDRVDADH